MMLPRGMSATRSGARESEARPQLGREQPKATPSRRNGNRPSEAWAKTSFREEWSGGWEDKANDSEAIVRRSGISQRNLVSVARLKLHHSSLGAHHGFLSKDGRLSSPGDNHVSCSKRGKPTGLSGERCSSNGAYRPMGKGRQSKEANLPTSAGSSTLYRSRTADGFGERFRGKP